MQGFRKYQYIRDKYEVSQKDFSEVLDWGRATITRYENHQVQDRAHDDVLRTIDSDPKWFQFKRFMPILLKILLQVV